jgi:methanogenic corrinoid protein MtbC1
LLKSVKTRLCNIAVKANNVKAHLSLVRSSSALSHGDAGLYREGVASVGDHLGLGSFDLHSVEKLARACLSQQHLATDLVRSWARSGRDLEEIYLDLVAPAARLLGEWWSCDSINFADATIGAHRLQQVLYEFSPQFLEHCGPKANGLSVLLVVTPGAQHTLGSFMLSEFFRREGWRVDAIVPKSDAELLRRVEGDWYDLVGLSLGHERGVVAAKWFIGQAKKVSRNAAIQFMVGGPLVTGNPAIAAELGADMVGANARESQRLAIQGVRRARQRAQMSVV